MGRTLRNIVKHELIGLMVEVRSSTNKYDAGIRGKVVDETMNMIIISTDKGEKSVRKAGSEFVFEVGGRRIRVSGNLISKRPDDRIKIKNKRWI